MTGTFPLVVLAAAVAGFSASGVYYTIFQGPLAAARPDAAVVASPFPWTYAVEFVRTLVTAGVAAAVASVAEIDSWVGGLALSLALWVGFPLMLWVGALLHEGTGLRLAAIHAGDWLIKLALIGTIVGAWSPL